MISLQFHKAQVQDSTYAVWLLLYKGHRFLSPLVIKIGVFLLTEHPWKVWILEVFCLNLLSGYTKQFCRHIRGRSHFNMMIYLLSLHLPYHTQYMKWQLQLHSSLNYSHWVYSLHKTLFLLVELDYAEFCKVCYRIDSPSSNIPNPSFALPFGIGTCFWEIGYNWWKECVVAKLKGYWLTIVQSESLQEDQCP